MLMRGIKRYSGPQNYYLVTMIIAKGTMYVLERTELFAISKQASIDIG